MKEPDTNYPPGNLGMEGKINIKIVLDKSSRKINKQFN